MDQSPEGADFQAFLREQRAVSELGRRRVALESRVLGFALAASFGPGLLGAMLVRGWERSAGVIVHRHGCGDLGFLVPMSLALLLARLVARRMLRARQDAWIEELALLHEVPADRLRAALPRDDGVI